jgi:8-oxo-dGTP pyrophosphatase MutT (NUDIX family)
MSSPLQTAIATAGADTLAGYVTTAADLAILPKHVATAESYREWAAKLARNGAAVCLVICPSTKKFLLDLRGDEVEHPGTYGLPGGALEDDETPMAGALRELYEETGKRVKKADSVIKLAKGLWCVVVIVKKQFRARASEESAHIAWHETMPPKSKLHPAMAKSRKMYMELIQNHLEAESE